MLRIERHVTEPSREKASPPSFPLMRWFELSGLIQSAWWSEWIWSVEFPGHQVRPPSSEAEDWTPPR